MLLLQNFYALSNAELACVMVVLYEPGEVTILYMLLVTNYLYFCMSHRIMLNWNY